MLTRKRFAAALLALASSAASARAAAPAGRAFGKIVVVHGRLRLPLDRAFTLAAYTLDGTPVGRVRFHDPSAEAVGYDVRGLPLHVTLRLELALVPGAEPQDASPSPYAVLPDLSRNDGSSPIYVFALGAHRSKGPLDFRVSTSSSGPSPR